MLVVRESTKDGVVWVRTGSTTWVGLWEEWKLCAFSTATNEILHPITLTAPHTLTLSPSHPLTVSPSYPFTPLALSPFLTPSHPISSSAK